ncbi:MAG: ATP-binding cassette domain-containing protein, partial [Pseudomonadota bacterium]
TVQTRARGEQQQVEILKLLYRKARVVILDEPTAVLTPQEIDPLFEKLRTFQNQGKTVIIITHKLKEILAYTQKVTVMRSGEVITTKDTHLLTEDLLSELIMGRPKRVLPRRKSEPDKSTTVLELSSLSTQSSTSRPLKDIHLSISAGEILGIAGIEGQGQKELVDVLCQLTPFSGTAKYLGEPLTLSSAYSKRQTGFSLVPLDRQKEGLLLDFSNSNNFLLGHQRESRFFHRHFLSSAKIQAFSQKLMNRFDVRPPNPLLKARTLSGGNQQKLLIARETSSGVRFLLACHPTRGIDIGSIEFIHSHLLELADKRAGILLISSDLDELFSLADSIAVMREGRITFHSPTKNLSPTELGLWMTGAKT